VDVMIVGRGGGSIEDLWAFNDEAVQRAIFASRAPVVSAVGHETDFTLADYTADLRAPTPSAAAELIVPDQLEIAMRLGSYTATLESCLRHELDVRADRLERLLEDMEAARPDIESRATALAALLRRAQGSVQRLVAGQRTAVDGRLIQLASLSPSAVLGRGYAVVHHKDGRLVPGSAATRVGETVSVRMHDGAFAAAVKKQ
jgi:exodeoxyribonuclease VII large subunit